MDQRIVGEKRSKRPHPPVIAPEPLRRELDVTRLDELIGTLENLGDEAPEDDRDLLLEHLRSARQHLLGAMPVEYTMDLEDAIFAARRWRAGQLRDQAEQRIELLLREGPESGASK